MTRGVYTAATGMLANQAAQDTIAQNLANANTVGYKEDVPRFESFLSEPVSRLLPAGRVAIGTIGSGAGLRDVTTNFSQGGLQQSGNPLDVALTGDGAERGTSDPNIDAGVSPEFAAATILAGMAAGTREILVGDGPEMSLGRLRGADPDRLFDMMAAGAPIVAR